MEIGSSCYADSRTLARSTLGTVGGGLPCALREATAWRRTHRFRSSARAVSGLSVWEELWGLKAYPRGCSTLPRSAYPLGI